MIKELNMKKVLVVLLCVFLTGCASSGWVKKFDAEGTLLEKHQWYMDGQQAVEIPEKFKGDTKTKSLLDGLITTDKVEIEG